VKPLPSLVRAVSVLFAVALVSASGQGSAREPRVEHLVDDYAGSFSPDGKMIVYYRLFSTLRYGVDTHPVEKRAVLRLMRADGSRLRELRHAGAKFEYDPSFSPSGRSILFVRDDRIFLMRRNGSGAHVVRRDTLKQSCPRFSPDGSKISFWRGRSGKSGGYFVMHADGTGLRRISGGQRFDWGCPSWFPEGKRLVFAKDFNLYVASIDGAGVEQLTQGNTFYRPSVSPDGSWIACDGVARRSRYGIILMRADGKQIRRITTGANEIENDAGASWSPDSRQIVFSGHRGFKGFGVYVVNRDGSGLRRLSNFRR
jgi:Tol biopolymer transport system component